MSFSGIRLDAALPMASYAVDLGGPYSSLGDMRLGAMMPLDGYERRLARHGCSSRGVVANRK